MQFLVHKNNMEVSEDAAWHSIHLKFLYLGLGWFAFAAWSISFYPQVLLNYRRKSVVGLNFDFVVFNFTKHSSYLIYNAVLYFSPTVQQQYRAKYGRQELIPVAPSDVAFSIHAVLLTAFTMYQVLIYERGNQRVSKACAILSIAAWGSALLCFFIALPTADWLWLIDVFNLIQLVMTAIKYVPQAWMNFKRKSTIGWSIGNILLDLSGGVANLLQMAVQSVDQKSLRNFSGNIGKLGLSFEVILFDVFFTVQHYFLYPQRFSTDEGFKPLIEGGIENANEIFTTDHKA